MSNNKTFGVDIGGIIIDRVDDGADTSFFGKNYLNTPPVPGVFAALEKLTASGFRVHLVSKCGESVQGKSLKWLMRRDFYQLTGVDPSDVHFCRTRPEKARICSDIGATHFVDDRLEVLSYLPDVEHRYLLNATAKEVAQFRHALADVTRVESWDALVSHVLSLALIP